MLAVDFTATSQSHMDGMDDDLGYPPVLGTSADPLKSSRRQARSAALAPERTRSSWGRMPTRKPSYGNEAQEVGGVFPHENR